MVRCDRVLASDRIDTLERQSIEHGTGLLLPLEIIDSLVGAPTAHTTARTHALSVRAATVFFAHFGIEWNLAAATGLELDALRSWIELYEAHRPLLHTGQEVLADQGDPALRTRGAVPISADEAVFAVVQSTEAWRHPPARSDCLDSGRM